jgi:hypothetical protein
MEAYENDLERVLKGTNTDVLELNVNPVLSNIRLSKSTVGVKGIGILMEKLNEGNQLASREPRLFKSLSSNNRIISTTGSGSNTRGGWCKGSGELVTKFFE